MKAESAMCSVGIFLGLYVGLNTFGYVSKKLIARRNKKYYAELEKKS